MADDMTHRAGHVYYGATVSGEARAQFGDSHNYYHSSSQDERAKNAIIESLDFEGRDERSRVLSNEGRLAFDWILESEANVNRMQRKASRDVLQRWLSPDHKSQVFWVTGKPGSGKTTLMKCIRDHRQLGRLLRAWANGSDPIIVEHFFWIAGNPLQRSIVGLFRSLLHGILSALTADDDLETFKHICSPRWTPRSLCAQWSYRELKEALNRACFSAKLNLMFAIDGLDECEARDHHALVSELWEFRTCMNVKMLLSSRPWPLFAQRFDHTPQLRMEDFNMADIRDYAWAQLTESELNQQANSDFRYRSPEANRLVATIAGRSEGVFLWTALVLKDLALEIRKGVTVRSLFGLVDAYPEGLTQYFRNQTYGRVLRSRKDKVDTANALKLLILIKRHGRSLYTRGSLVAFSLLRQGYLLQPLLDFPSLWYDRNQAAQEVSRTVSFLRETCGDLVHVTDTRTSLATRVRVDSLQLTRDVVLIHRTAFDFLLEDEILGSIEANCSEQLKCEDVVDRLAEMCFLTILHETRLDCLLNDEFLLPLASGFDYRRIADELYMTRRRRCEQLLIEQLDICCSCRQMSWDFRHLDEPHWSLTMSEACFNSDLRHYPMAMLLKFPHLAFQRPERAEDNDDHLTIWLSCGQERQRQCSAWDPAKQLDTSILEELLELGCETKINAWHTFIGKFTSLEYDATCQDNIATIIILMLESGADPDCVFQALCSEHNRIQGLDHPRQRPFDCRITNPRIPERWHAPLLEKLSQVSHVSARDYRSRRQRLRAIKIMRDLEANSTDTTYFLGAFSEFLRARFPRLEFQYRC